MGAEIARVFKTMFDWPYGIVVGNLIASIMWAAPAFIHLHIRLRRHERKLDQIAGK